MSGYRLFGAETSPYSIKVRSFLRYKNARFEWVPRSRDTEAEFKNLASVPTVPLLLSPDGTTNQDSTDIIATLEADHPSPSAVPDDPACAALALILEDYADEWLNKCMFYQRWGRSPDKEAAAHRVLHQLYNGKLPAKKEEASKTIVARMEERLPNVGAGLSNAEVLTASFYRFTELLDVHLSKHLYLFGGRPSAADFALARPVAPNARRSNLRRIFDGSRAIRFGLEHVHGRPESRRSICDSRGSFRNITADFQG